MPRNIETAVAAVIAGVLVAALLASLLLPALIAAVPPDTLDGLTLPIAQAGPGGD